MSELLMEAAESMRCLVLLRGAAAVTWAVTPAPRLASPVPKGPAAAAALLCCGHMGGASEELGVKQEMKGKDKTGERSGCQRLRLFETVLKVRGD